MTTINECVSWCYEMLTGIGTEDFIAYNALNAIIHYLSAEQVEHPNHYSDQDGSGIECIDAIKASMTDEEYKGFIKGNVMKYLWRSGRKDSTDIAKAQYYINLL